jgi:Cu/Ag efflux pump CusA
VSLQPGLPKGVEIVATYDRSELIHRSVATLRDRLIEEFIIVTLVCAGSEVMRRIAAPMVGGMITAPMLSMLVLPAAYLLLHRRQLRRPAN